jgi:prepilin-type N-terminal cleavage/methylation domain-containing protein
MKVNTKFKFALLRSLNKRSHHQDGFTLIEVIVAVVVLSIFILAAMSALVIGLNGKLKSKLNNEATLVIEQDLEKVRYAATQFGYQVKVNSDTTNRITPATAISSTSLFRTVYSAGTTTFTSSAASTPTSPVGNSIISTNRTIDLTLTIPVITSSPQSHLSTANTNLSIGTESNAYRLTSAITTPSSPTSLAVTVDLSNVSSLNSTTLAANASATSITVPSTDIGKFIVGDRIVVGTLTSGSPIFGGTVVTVINNTTTSTLTLNNTISGYAVGATPVSGTPVIILPRTADLITNNDLCKSTTNNIATTFRDALSDLSPTRSPVTFNTRQYQVTRTPTATSNTRVKIVYGVRDLSFSTGTDLADLTTEVIPSVTFQCP